MEITIGGNKFEVAPEPADFWGWVAEGRYDSEWNTLRTFLHADDTFVDIGAWVGSHSLFASTIAKRVIAVEPDPVAYAILKQNVDPSLLHCIAITGSEGTVTLGSGFLGASTTRQNPNAGGGIGAWEPGHQFEIASTTLRKFVELLKLQDPLFLKIDVEGAEEEIVKDFEFFAEHKPTVYLETHSFWWKDEATTWENIRKLGRLYKHCYGWKGVFYDVDLNQGFKNVLFTDRTL